MKASIQLCLAISLAQAGLLACAIISSFRQLINHEVYTPLALGCAMVLAVIQYRILINEENKQ